MHINNSFPDLVLVAWHPLEVLDGLLHFPLELVIFFECISFATLVAELALTLGVGADVLSWVIELVLVLNAAGDIADSWLTSALCVRLLLEDVVAVAAILALLLLSQIACSAPTTFANRLESFVPRTRGLSTIQLAELLRA